jgi:hypothetical protein
VLIVGQNRVDVVADSAFCQLHEPAEEAVDSVAAAVISGELVPATEVPHHVFGEQVVEAAKSPLAKAV